MKLIRNGLPIVALMATSAVAHADLMHGKQLLTNHCTKCHGTSVYSREDRRIRNLVGLQKQVAGCTRAAGVTWSQQDISDVVEYLNTTFYHFK